MKSVPTSPCRAVSTRAVQSDAVMPPPLAATTTIGRSPSPSRCSAALAALKAWPGSGGGGGAACRTIR